MPKAYVTYEKWKAKEGHIIVNWIKILPPNKTWLSMPEDFEKQFSFEKEHWILHKGKQWTDYSSA